jgi:type II secretory pathway pseudopilin PulG
MQPKAQSVNRLGNGRLGRRRAATTLVELLIVITLVSLLLSIVGTLAVRLRQWDRQMRDRSQHGDQFVKLGESIRADIRRARNVTQPDQKTIAIAGSDSREIRYELESDGCRRTMKSPGNTSSTVDRFAIGAAKSWKLENAASGRRPACTIALDLDSEHASSVSAPFFVYAALGADTP